MNPGRALAYGGTAVAAGTVAVLSLAVSHAVALRDVAAFPVSAAPIVVPAGASSQSAARAPESTPGAGERRATHPVTQVVQAPQPGTVATATSPQPEKPSVEDATAPRQKPSVKHRTPAKAAPDAGHDLPREWTGSERKKSRSSSPAERD